MTGIAPGWYRDPADTTTQRYWDGEGWVGQSLPADVEPPPGPPPTEAAQPPKVPLGSDTARAAPADKAAPARPSAVPPATAEVGAQDVPTPAGTGHRTSSAQLRLPPGARIPPDWVYTRPAPPPTPHGLPLASPGARLVARLVDIAAVGGLALLANAWFLYQLGRELGSFADALRAETAATQEVAGRINWLVFVILLITAAVWLAYEVPAIASTGQTPGKRVLGIKVMRLENDERLGVGRALRRWTTLGLPTILWSCGVGFVLQFVDCLFVATDYPLHQALHDKSARTVVVRVSATPAESDGKSTDGGTP